MFCMLLFVALLSVGSVYGENSCRACNCQFDNVQVLTELIERIVNDTLLTGMREDIVNTLQNHFGTCSYSFVCVHYLLIRIAPCLATWTPVNLTYIGKADFGAGTTATFHFQIPDIIPDSASEFLLYATLNCGYSDNIDMRANIIFYVERKGIRFEKFLLMHGYYQDAWNTNSDNMWFPLPADRQIHLEIVPIAFRKCSSRLWVIGYR